MNRHPQRHDYDTDEFEKPRPPARHISIREFRELVNARHKYLASTKPFEEALELLEEYGGDRDSTEAFVSWLRGAAPTEAPTKGAIERTHIVTDPETGEETRVESQPGSIPPRPQR